MKMPSWRAAPAGHHQRGRGGQAQRARAGDDQHGQRGADRVLRPGCPASSQPGQRQRPTQASTAGTNTAADPVGQPLDAPPSPPGPARPARSGARAGCRRPTLTARTTSRPVTTTVPAVTASPSAASTGHRLPGHHAAVHRGLAELHLPVGGDPLPGPDHEPLARPQLRRPGPGARSRRRPARRRPARPAAASSRIASPASRRARASYSRPASRNVVTDAATSR